MSSLDSMLNSASTIFTIDLYKRHWNKEASSRKLVIVGRIMTGVFVVIGCLWAPTIVSFGSVYEYIQKIWGFISPGIVAAFVFGIIVRKAPPIAATGAMILGVPIYGLCLFFMPDVAFLHHMMITFVILILYMAIVTRIKPLTEPKTMPVNNSIDLTTLPAVKLWGGMVVLATITLYIIFW
jgi:SSS family solute:Na+ symporter